MVTHGTSPAKPPLVANETSAFGRTERPIVVAICADILMEEPLYTFLFSMISHTRRFLKIYFFYDGFHHQDIQRLEKCIRHNYNNFSLNLIRRAPAANAWKKLHGNAYTYTKLYMPEHASEDRILYLDVDMIINLDVGELFDEDLCGKTVGAAGVGTIEWVLDRGFFVELGLDASEAYFNGGMLLIDARRWKQEKITDQCVDFVTRYRSRLSSHDQSALNFVFYKKFKALDDRYNTQLYPTGKAVISELPAIYHFVGSPKPWDPGGKWLNNNYNIYEASLRMVGRHPLRFSLVKIYKKVRRLSYISKQYYQCVKNHIHARMTNPT